MAEENPNDSYPDSPNGMPDLSLGGLLPLILSCCLGFAMLLIIIISMALVGYLTGDKSPTGSGGTGTGSNIKGGNCSILFPSKAGSDDQIGNAIDQWIAQKVPSSPLRGKGRVFAASGRGSNVHPALIAAIALKESSLGTHIPDTTYNPFGRTASASQPAYVSDSGRRWYKFNSWDEAISEEGPYIKRQYTDRGLTTLGPFLNRYAPSSENNTDLYISQVAGWMNEMIGLANGALGDPCVETGTQAGQGGQDNGQCLNSKPIEGPSCKNSCHAQATLSDKLAQLWSINKTWRVTEACPPSSQHQDRNHYNGRAVDIAIFPQNNANQQTINQLLSDIRKVGFDDVLNEYKTSTKFTTAGHIHLEWHGQ